MDKLPREGSFRAGRLVRTKAMLHYESLNVLRLSRETIRDLGFAFTTSDSSLA
jgi:hypothetical protein